MTAIDTLRIALYGSPPDPAHEPSREGVLAAFTEVYGILSSNITTIAGYATVAAMEAVTPDEGTLAYVYANNADPGDAANGFYQYNGSAWIVADWLNVALTPDVANPDASNNYFIGGAGNDENFGADNSGIGYEAARDLTSGSNNTDVGRGAGRGNTDGDYNVNIGHSAGLLITGGDHNARFGYNAQGEVVGTSSRVAVFGAYAGRYYQGNEVALFGYNAGGAATTGVRITAVGASAAATVTTNDAITCLGWNADISEAARDASYDNITVIGANAEGTFENQVVLGDGQVTELRMFNMAAMRGLPTVRSWYAGNAGNVNTGNQGCIGIGEGVLSNSTTSSNTIGIGDHALFNHEGSNGSVAIGNNAMRESLTINDSTVVGTGALQAQQTGVGFTILGFRAAQNSITGANITAVGDSAGWQYQDSGGCFMGYVVAELLQTGEDVIAIGRATARHRLNGDFCIFMGAEAGGFFDAPGIDIEANVGAVAAGDFVIGIGRRALAHALGDDAVAIGHLAAQDVTDGTDCVFLGSGAGVNGSQKLDVIGSTVVGANAFCTRDNEIVIGKSSDTHVTIAGVTFTKAQIEALLAMVA